MQKRRTPLYGQKKTYLHSSIECHFEMSIGVLVEDPLIGLFEERRGERITHHHVACNHKTYFVRAVHLRNLHEI